MSSATRFAAAIRRSSSTSTTRWEHSTCVACGECVQACPTGALAPPKDAYLTPTDRTVESLCPYCGVGCQLTYHLEDNRIVRVEGRDGPAQPQATLRQGTLGFDYVNHPQRLTRAVDTQGRCAEVRRLRHGSRRSDVDLSRGELGGGA